eukprot:6489983-Amphidinium_carterae.1
MGPFNIKHETKVRATPAKIDFKPERRPATDKMIVPNFTTLSEGILPKSVGRYVAEHWIDNLWYSEDNNHCYIRSWGHIEGSQRNLPKYQRDREKAMYYYYGVLKNVN